jgi:hypothetical protein
MGLVNGRVGGITGVIGAGAGGATGVDGCADGAASPSNVLRNASRKRSSSPAGAGVCAITWAGTAKARDETIAQNLFVKRIGRGDCEIFKGASNNR